MDKATDHEVVSIYRHSDEQIDQLMTKAPECVLMWGTKDGWPVGVVHSFVWHDRPDVPCECRCVRAFLRHRRGPSQYRSA